MGWKQRMEGTVEFRMDANFASAVTLKKMDLMSRKTCPTIHGDWFQQM